MDYRAALSWLDGVQTHGIKLGLRNMTALLEAMGRPQDSYPSLAVAGTNGKGSVCAFLASILRAAGLRTGLYTSPHLVRYEERLAIDGAPITPDDFALAVARVKTRIDAMLASGGLESHPTHFEVLTAAALAHFREREVEAAVLEVGLGGRLDAVAAAGARVAVITHVSLDHTTHLGKTVEAIAVEKAGIVGEGCRVAMTGERDAGALERIREAARARNVPLIEAATAARIEDADPSRRSFRLRTARADYGPLTIPLEGSHQIENAALAVLAAEALAEDVAAGVALSPAAVMEGLRRTRWPGRIQIVALDPLVILDGAHNPGGCASLARWVKEGLDPRRRERLCLVFGALQDKDAGPMAKELFPLAARIVLTHGRSDRFRDPESLLALAREAGSVDVVTAQTAGEAIEAARAWAGRSGAVLLCGSLYLVGDALEALGLDPYEERAYMPSDR